MLPGTGETPQGGSDPTGRQGPGRTTTRPFRLPLLHAMRHGARYHPVQMMRETGG
ncbi:hypothetical protein [Komagataeibacter medellinensis]|uniref:hypothetical protein n=1 Tax=Komagataeibacter medellinensis TaxID=1177712 RepID=UPI0012974840|nr:hypothetical protein [Komagataeibacter medellinensis]